MAKLEHFIFPKVGGLKPTCAPHFWKCGGTSPRCPPFSYALECCTKRVVCLHIPESLRGDIKQTTSFIIKNIHAEFESEWAKWLFVSCQQFYRQQLTHDTFSSAPDARTATLWHYYMYIPFNVNARGYKCRQCSATLAVSKLWTMEDKNNIIDFDMWKKKYETTKIIV